MATFSDCPPEEDCDSSVSSTQSEDNEDWERDISELMVHIFTDITYSGPKDNHKCRLFDWFVDPLRTAKEFDFVIREVGPMYLKYSKSDNSRLKIYFAKVAAEALAVKCQILEDLWESIAWNVVKYGLEYKSSRYGSVSKHLSNWIINMIGNADLCPNPNLRVQLLILLKTMVKVDSDNERLAFDSVLSAVCELNVNFVLNKGSDGLRHNFLDSKTLVPSKDKNGIPIITINAIIYLWPIFSKNGYLMSWDKKLAQQLINVKNSKISTILSDVSFVSRLNPTKHTDPQELHSLVALFKFTVGFAQELVKSNDKNEEYELKEVITLLNLLIERFYFSCQTPQLSTLTLSCIIDVLETVLLCRSELYDDNISEALTSIEWMFKKSSNVQRIIKGHHSQFEGRLKYIRNSWYNMRKNEEESESDNDEESNASSRSNCSLRQLLEKCLYERFIIICKFVFNETFDPNYEASFAGELRILSNDEVLFNNDKSSSEDEISDSETSSDADSYDEWYQID